MKARVAIQIGVSPAEYRLLKKAAERRRLQLATWVREAAILTAETNPDLARHPMADATGSP